MASALGIDEVRAGVLPDDKRAPVEELRAEGHHVAMVGGNLMSVLRAHKLAHARLRNIQQSPFFAFAYNAICMPVTAGVLYPFFGTLLSSMITAAAMSLSSVSVITNALRLRRLKL